MSPKTEPRPLAMMRVQYRVMAVALLLLLIKTAAYWATSSVAILTDALESIVNVATSVIGFYTLRYAIKPRDADHPYGHGKVELVAASAEGILVAIAGAGIVYEGLLGLWRPPVVHDLGMGAWLLLITAGINYAMGAYSVRVGRKVRSLALVASGKHLQTDMYSTLGVVGGVGLMMLTGWGWIDALVALLLGVGILVAGIRILRQTIGGIMDEADFVLLKSLAEELERHRPENWIDLHNLRIVKYGGVIHIDCHMTVPWFITIREAHREIDLFRRLAKEQFGEEVETFIHTDGCQPYSCNICARQPCAYRQRPFQKRLSWDTATLTKDQKHRLQQ